MKRKDLVSQVISIIQSNPPKPTTPAGTVLDPSGNIVTLGNVEDRNKNLLDTDDNQEIDSGYKY